MFADIYYVKHSEFPKICAALDVKRSRSVAFVIDFSMCEEALKCSLEIWKVASQCKYVLHWLNGWENRTWIHVWYSSMYQIHLTLWVRKNEFDITTQHQVHVIQATISDTLLVLSIYFFHHHKTRSFKYN